MVLSNLQQVNLHSTSYFSVKEFAYLQLANQIYKQHMQAAVEKQSIQAGTNKLIRNNVFRQQPRKSGPVDRELSLKTDLLSDPGSSFKPPHKTTIAQNPSRPSGSST